MDLNKALVPAPVTYRKSNGEDSLALPEKGVISGIFSSFSKAPPGYGTTVSIGGEYWYQDQFAARAGYFYENKNNGDRQYFTCGLGVRYSVFGLNFSYLVPSGSGVARNPLSNTLRFSLLSISTKEPLRRKKDKENTKVADVPGTINWLCVTDNLPPYPNGRLQARLILYKSLFLPCKVKRLFYFAQDPIQFQVAGNGLLSTV